MNTLKNDNQSNQILPISKVASGNNIETKEVELGKGDERKEHPKLARAH